MATGFVQIRDFFGGGWGEGVGEGWGQGSDSSPSHLVADGEVACCAAPPQKPYPGICPSGHVIFVPRDFLHPLRGLTPPNFLRTLPTNLSW